MFKCRVCGVLSKPREKRKLFKLYRLTLKNFFHDLSSPYMKQISEEIPVCASCNDKLERGEIEVCDRKSEYTPEDRERISRFLNGVNLTSEVSIHSVPETTYKESPISGKSFLGRLLTSRS